jgi:hypothetical protein
MLTYLLYTCRLTPVVAVHYRRNETVVDKIGGNCGALTPLLLLKVKVGENTAQTATQLSLMAKDIQTLKTDLKSSRISLSATDLGGSEIQKIEMNGDLLTYQPTSASENSIINFEENAFVQGLTSEGDLVKFINSKLSQATIYFETSNCLLEQTASVALNVNQE